MLINNLCPYFLYLNNQLVVLYPFDVSVLARAAGIGAIDDKNFYKKTVELNKSERNYIYSELDSIGIKYLKTNTNFILINLKKDADECVKKLLYKGIIVRPMKNYNLPNFFRLTIGRKRHNKRFLKALKELL